MVNSTFQNFPQIISPRVPLGMPRRRFIWRVKRLCFCDLGLPGPLARSCKILSMAQKRE
jgi:hypothetical protein